MINQASGGMALGELDTLESHDCLNGIHLELEGFWNMWTCKERWGRKKNNPISVNLPKFLLEWDLLGKGPFYKETSSADRVYRSTHDSRKWVMSFHLSSMSKQALRMGPHHGAISNFN